MLGVRLAALCLVLVVLCPGSGQAAPAPAPGGNPEHGPPKVSCEAWCVNACTDLNGNVQTECGGCGKDQGCHPEADGFKTWQSRRKDAIEKEPERFGDEDLFRSPGASDKPSSGKPTPSPRPKGFGLSRRAPNFGTKSKQGSGDDLVSRAAAAVAASRDGDEVIKDRRTDAAGDTNDGSDSAPDVGTASQNPIKNCPARLPPRGETSMYRRCALLVGKTISDDGFLQNPSPKWTDDDSAFYLIRGVPLLISKLPDALNGRQAQGWLEWLTSMEKEWKSRNGGTTRVSKYDSSNGYALFKDALASDGAISEYAKNLIKFIRNRFFVMQQQIQDVISKEENESVRSVLMRALGQDQCAKNKCTEMLRDTVLYSWANIFRKTGEYANEAFVDLERDSAWEYQGYIMYNSTGTGTSFWSDFDGGHIFTMKDEANYVIMMPGGIRYAAHRNDKYPGAADPGVTQAFDIGIEKTAKGYGAKLLDDAAEDYPDETPLYKWDYEFMRGQTASERTFDDIPYSYSFD